MHISTRLILGVCFTLRLAGNRAVLIIWLAATLIVAGYAGPAIASPPSIAKAFGVSSIPVGGVTSLTLTISNPNVAPVFDVGFTDNLPSGLVVSTPNDLNSSCGGTATATAGSGTVSLSMGTVVALGSCSVSLHVTTTSAGSKNNSVTVTSTGGTGNASASLSVVAPPAISKQFGVASLGLGRSTSLTFTITNINGDTSLTGIAFTDNLPAGLLATTFIGNSTCMGEALILNGVVSLTGGIVSAIGGCSISVNVTATSLGMKFNAVTVTSTNGGQAIRPARPSR